MNEYEESYTSTRDIDWFGVINGHYIHVASCRGRLPVEVNDRVYLRDLQYEVAMLDDFQNIDGSAIDILHNDGYLQRRFANYENAGETLNRIRKVSTPSLVKASGLLTKRTSIIQRIPIIA